MVTLRATTEAITGMDEDDPKAPEPPGGVSAETRRAGNPCQFPVTHPAHPMRCHVEDGLAIRPSTLRMIACNATISTMLHDAGGSVLNVGRRTRRSSAALRRAARERDRYRCRFPGCESRRIDLHHIVFWANGGHTRLENIICLCKRHHAIVHDKGIIIAAAADGFAFYMAEGTPIHAKPATARQHRRRHHHLPRRRHQPVHYR